MKVPAFTISEDLAWAIITMDDIAYGEGLGPYTDEQIAVWRDLLKTAELIVGEQAYSTRGTYE